MRYDELILMNSVHPMKTSKPRCKIVNMSTYIEKRAVSYGSTSEHCAYSKVGIIALRHIEIHFCNQNRKDAPG